MPRFLWLLLALALAGCGAPADRFSFTSPPAPTATAVSPATPPPIAGSEYVVRQGDTLSAISRASRISLGTLAGYNALKPPYLLRVGQRLRLIPLLETVSPSPIPATASATTAPKPSPFTLPKAGFAWPLEGRLISSFGAQEGGRFNDGVNISARPGDSVRATAPGTVLFASGGVGGFGLLLILDHGGGWTSIYAHNESFTVTRGNKVQQGDIIARAGSSGSVTKPQLHFEIRRQRRAVDPLALLPPRVQGGSSPLLPPTLDFAPPKL